MATYWVRVITEITVITEIFRELLKGSAICRSIYQDYQDLTQQTISKYPNFEIYKRLNQIKYSTHITNMNFITFTENCRDKPSITKFCNFLWNKKGQHRRWHTAKCNKLYQLTWNINARDTAIPLHGRHFVSHLGICSPICIKLLQLMSGIITYNLVKKRSLCINKWLSYSQLYCFTAAILSAILEFVIGFVSIFYNWCPVSLRTIQS